MKFNSIPLFQYSWSARSAGTTQHLMQYNQESMTTSTDDVVGTIQYVPSNNFFFFLVKTPATITFGKYRRNIFQLFKIFYNFNIHSYMSMTVCELCIYKMCHPNKNNITLIIISCEKYYISIIIDPKLVID